MCIETNIRNAEAYIKKGLHQSAKDYIQRIREQIIHMPYEEREKIEKKYYTFIQRYIQKEAE